MLWYQTRSLSQQKGFFSGGNGELEFLIVSSSFFCSLLWWPLLLGLVNTWYYKAVFSKLYGTNSVSMFWQVSCAACRWTEACYCLHHPWLSCQQKSVTHSYSSDCNFLICSRYCSPLQNVGFPEAIIHWSLWLLSGSRLCCITHYFGLSWIPASPLYWNLNLAVPLENQRLWFRLVCYSNALTLHPCWGGS